LLEFSSTFEYIITQTSARVNHFLKNIFRGKLFPVVTDGVLKGQELEFPTIWRIPSPKFTGPTGDMAGFFDVNPSKIIFPLIDPAYFFSLLR
jgi:hypothetical protein